MRIIKKYQQKNSISAPAYWFELSPEYNNEEDNQNRSDSDDYSFLNYAGDKRFGITLSNMTCLKCKATIYYASSTCIHSIS